MPDRDPVPVVAQAPLLPRPPRRTTTALVAALVTLALVIGTATATVVVDTNSGADQAQVDARAFLDRYVTSDGQVLRRDQGSDTVSEGQAYGLLLAQVAGDGPTFDRIWRWTRAHLSTPDQLLAWHATGSGRVTDAMPASDADVLTAWALARRGGEDLIAARQIAAAVLATEAAHGDPSLLAAGPWATGMPASLNPSYWMPQAFRGLAEATGDPRWTELERGARAALTGRLTAGGRRLVPDWARLDGVRATPTPAPNGQAPQVRYGLDAQRTVVWLAASCDPADRRLAAGWWPILRRPGRAGAIALSPSGRVIDARQNAVSFVAAAAAAQAAGDPGAAQALFDRARQLQNDHPTYYGGAWLALGGELLHGSRLSGCSTATPGGSQ